jgi:hypothetical protein
MTSTSLIGQEGGNSRFSPKGDLVVVTKFFLMNFFGVSLAEAPDPDKDAGIARGKSGEGAVWTQYSKFVDVDTVFAAFNFF